MNLAILHYHLNPGGVTRVVANHVASLDAVSGGVGRVVVLHGGGEPSWPAGFAESLANVELAVVSVPELAYDSTTSSVDPVSAADGLSATIRRELERHEMRAADTVLHWHNHSLGKNVAVPRAVVRLAEAGYATVLQVHDFAEDFRPKNFPVELAGGRAGPVYPRADHVHYAVLNRRDLVILRSCGVADDRVHLLANPVAEMQSLPERGAARAKLSAKCGVREDATYVLYPVRGIRRKNVGELLLWSALAAAETWFAITLAPQNPAEFAYYDRWRNDADAMQLPCLFDVGGDEGLSFLENLAAADAIINTSVAEGFGMVFLEAWLAGRPLVGRDLPEISVDFVEAGLDLSALESRLDVPVDWIGRDRLRDATYAAYSRVVEAYDRQAPAVDEFDRWCDAKWAAGFVDFADLDESLQRDVLGRVQSSPSAAEAINERNPWVRQSLDRKEDDVAALVAANTAVVRDAFSTAACGRRLNALYDVASSGDRTAIETAIEPEQVVDAFLDFSRFRMIRG